MNISDPSATPIAATVFRAANSRAYLRAVFEAWGQSETVMALPGGMDEVPGLNATRTESFAPDPGWFQANLPSRNPEGRALVAFSSGTTGRPKAILLQHRALDDVVIRINDAMALTGEVREYLGVPVNFSFGFGRARAVAAAGGHAFLPEHGFDPAEIGRMLGAGEINAVSAVPTLWRVLLAHAETIPTEAARHLRWIEIGSQWMTGAEKLALRQLFPNARIVQHYGLTEASRSALLDISEAPEDRLDSIGRATGEVEIDIDEDGRIRVRGPHVAEGLVTEAGIVPVADEDGWLTTSDRGRQDGEWVYYEGRVDELVNVGGIKIDPTAFEQKLNDRLGVPGAAAAGRLEDSLRGEKLLIALRQDAGIDREAALVAAEEVAAGYGLTGRGGLELREVADLPLTATGKVRRADLAGLEARGGADTGAEPGASVAPTPAPARGTPDTARLQTLWAEILGVKSVPVDRGFYDLGGDSLSALTAVLAMEKAGLDPDVARGIFDGRTIAQLTGATEEQSTDSAASPRLGFSQAINAVHATRGVLVLWVVIIHWLPAFLERALPSMAWIYEAMVPAWRLGTPGFAIVFGMGIGALRMAHYRDNREMFHRSLRLSTILVVGGVLALGAINLGVVVARGQFGERLPMSGLFYSAILYYALALLTLPLMVRLLWLGSNRLLTIFAICAATMAIHQILSSLIGQTRPPAFFEFLKIASVAKYGFFRMTGYVMVGVAIGWLFREHRRAPNIIGLTAAWGLIIATMGLATVSEGYVPGLKFSVDFRHVVIYAGVILMILAGFAWLNAEGPRGRIAGLFNAFFVASGILALPMFVGHEIIMAIKRLTDEFGIPDKVSLPVLLGIFFLGCVIAYRRVMRYFAPASARSGVTLE